MIAKGPRRGSYCRIYNSGSYSPKIRGVWYSPNIEAILLCCQIHFKLYMFCCLSRSCFYKTNLLPAIRLKISNCLFICGAHRTYSGRSPDKFKLRSTSSPSDNNCPRLKLISPVCNSKYKLWFNSHSKPILNERNNSGSPNIDSMMILIHSKKYSCTPFD